MDSKRAQEIYAELEKYVIQLDRDPASLGPKYLQDKICICRNYLNAVSHILQEIARERHTLAVHLQAEEAAYGVESADLLANDARIRTLPNIEDRKATIQVLLRDRSRRINELKGELLNLDFVEKVTRHRHHELRDTMAEIKAQRSLIRDEIDTKSFYGDETTEARGKGDPSKGSVLGIDEDDLAALFEEPSTSAQPAPESPKEAPSPPPVEVAPPVAPEPVKAEPEPVKEVPAKGEPTNTLCPICQGPQFKCPGGITCPEGHGLPGDGDDAPVAPPPKKGQQAMDDLDLEQIDEFLASPTPKPAAKKSDDEIDFESILASV